MLIVNPIFQLEISQVENNKSLALIKIGDDILESKQELDANEIAKLQEHIAFCNQVFSRKQ
jgi:hypothetical protein